MLGDDDVWIYNELYRSHYHPTPNPHHPSKYIDKICKVNVGMGEKTSCLRACVSSLLSNSCKNGLQRVLYEGSKGRY